MNKFGLCLVFSFAMASVSPSYGVTDNELRMGFAKLNEQLPMRLDGVTTLDSVILMPNKTISYRYTFEFEKAIHASATESGIPAQEIFTAGLSRFGSIEQWAKAWGDVYVYPIIRNRNCSTPESIDFMDSGYKLSHEMYDPEGRYLYEMVVDPDVCAAN
ncbi:MAG: hypothetical protein KAI85_16800 [Halopseudomonas aestusnigri]|jgi:hypothetical protein|nr:hypothetical protein [Halopseudomonas aestusnigri]